MMNQVLTPFSYAFAETGDVFDAAENVVVEQEIIEDVAEDVPEWDIEDVDNTADDEENTTDEDVISEENTEWEDNSEEGWDLPELGDEDPIGSWDVEDEIGTWSNVEISTGDVVDFTGDVEQLTWDILTWDVEDKIDYSQYTSETRVAVLANKLGINWEEDAEYYAKLAWIEEDYRGTAEQNEKIRLFFLDNLEAN